MKIGLIGGVVAFFFGTNVAGSSQAEATACTDDVSCILVEVDAFGVDPQLIEEYERVMPAAMSAALLHDRSYRLGTRETMIRNSPGEQSRLGTEQYQSLRDSGVDFLLGIEIYAGDTGIVMEAELESLADGWRDTLAQEQISKTSVLPSIDRVMQRLTRVIAERSTMHTPRRVLVLCLQDTSRPATSTSRWMSRELAELVTMWADSVASVDAWQEALPSDNCQYNDDYVRRLAVAGVDAVIDGTIHQSEQGFMSALRMYVVERKKFIPLVEAERGASFINSKHVLQRRVQDFLRAVITEDGSWNKEILERPGTTVPVVHIPLRLKVPDLIRRAESARAGGDLETASILARRAVELKPDSQEARRLLGLILFEQERWREAIDEFNKTITISPDMVAYSKLGESYTTLRDFDAAISAYEAALEQSQDDYGTLLALGRLNLYLRNYDQATQYYSRASRTRPNGVEAYLGLVSASERDVDARIEWARRALDVEPRNEVARRHLSSSLKRRGMSRIRERRYIDALEDFDSWVRLAPGPEAYSRRAFAYARAVHNGDISPEKGYVRAIEDYQTALSLDAEGPAALQRAGVGDVTHLNLQELLLLDHRYEESASVGRDFLEETNPSAGSKVIARFYLFVAEALDGKEYQEDLRLLNEALDAFEGQRLSWSFDLLSAYLERIDGIDDRHLVGVESILSVLKAL